MAGAGLPIEVSSGWTGRPSMARIQGSRNVPRPRWTRSTGSVPILMGEGTRSEGLSTGSGGNRLQDDATSLAMLLARSPGRPWSPLPGRVVAHPRRVPRGAPALLDQQRGAAVGAGAVDRHACHAPGRSDRGAPAALAFVAGRLGRGGYRPAGRVPDHDGEELVDPDGPRGFDGDRHNPSVAAPG